MSTLASEKQQQLEHYRRDGVLFPIPILTIDEARHYYTHFTRLASAFPASTVRRADSLHLFYRWAYELAAHPLILQAIRPILGDTILIDGSLILHKPPGDPAFVSWHQDSVYSGWHLTPSVSAWLALTPSYSENGCLRVIPRSHLDGVLAHNNIRETENLLDRGERVGIEIDDSRALDVTLRTGEMSLHHANIIHGSNSNRSDQTRTGFVIRYVTHTIRCRGRALLRICGNSDCSHLELVEPPMTDHSESAMAAWRSYSQSQSAAQS